MIVAPARAADRISIRALNTILDEWKERGRVDDLAASLQLRAKTIRSAVRRARARGDERAILRPSGVPAGTRRLPRSRADEALAMQEAEGLDYRQVAARMGVKPVTAKAMLCKARKRRAGLPIHAARSKARP